MTSGLLELAATCRLWTQIAWCRRYGYSRLI